MKGPSIRAWISTVAGSQEDFQNDVAVSAKRACDSPPPPKRRKILGDIAVNLANMPPRSPTKSATKVGRADTDKINLDPPKRYPTRTRTPSPTKLASLFAAGDTDQTPRPPVSTASHGSFLALDDSQPDDIPRASSDSESRTSQSTGASHRSSSPVKRVAALRQVAGGVTYPSLSDDAAELGVECKWFWDKLQEVVDDAVGIIPAVLKGDATFASLVRRKPRECWFASEDNGIGSAAVRQELESVCNIVKTAKRCSAEGDSEAEWNSAVHSPVLRLALGHDEDNVCFRHV
jgi:hypothetical protein